MKILFHIMNMELGGHIVSTMTLARGLKNRGHDVSIASGGGPLAKKLEGDKIKRYQVPHISESGHSLKPFSYLVKIVRQDNIDVLHGVDYYSTRRCLLAAAITGTPVAATHMGGPGTSRYPPFKPMIVFSEEQKARYIREYGFIEDHIEIVPHRIDMEEYKGIRSGRENDGLKRILVVSRLDGEYKYETYKRFFSIVPELAREVKSLEVVVLGGGNVFEKVKAAADRVNESYGKKLIDMKGPVVDLLGYYRDADLFVGSGRSALQAMSCGIPSVIFGEKGFSGVVNRQNLENIAYYNLSGRNAKQPVPDGEVVSTLLPILTDDAVAEKLGAEALEIVGERYDARAGARALEKIYEKLLNENSTGIGKRLYYFHKWAKMWWFRIVLSEKLHGVVGTDKSPATG